MTNRFHYTKHGAGGYVVYDRTRPIQTKKRVDTEAEAIAHRDHLAAVHEKKDVGAKGKAGG